MRYRLVAVGALFCFLVVNAAYAQNTYYLSQVVNGKYDGGSYHITFVLFNNTDSDTSAQLQITLDNGSPMTLTLTGLGTNSQFTIPLSAGASRIIESDGSGNLVTGSAKVTSAGKIGVSAVFTLYDSQGNYLTESGVSSSDPLTNFVLPVDTTGVSNTGLSLFNFSSSSATISMTLRDTGGNVTATLSPPLTLKAGEHLPRFIAGAGQFFPSATNFRGTLLVQSSVPIAALVLRSNSKPESYTSLPVVPTSATKTTLNLAQVANGGSFKTSFLVFNMSSGTANVTLSLTNNDGLPFQVNIPGSGTKDTFTFSLPGNGSTFLQTDGTGAQSIGAATITSNVPIGASAIFTVLDSSGNFQTEAGVGDSAVLNSLTLPVDVTGHFDTGVAFFNPGSSQVTLTFKLLDATGTIVGTSVKRDIKAKGHLAEFVTGIFAGVSSSNDPGAAVNALSAFRGSVAVSATANVAAVILRQYDNAPVLSYTTLAVGSGAATGKTPTPVVVPLLSRVQSGITVTGNITVNQTLPPGYKLTGTIGGPGRPTAVLATSAGASYIGNLDLQTGKYVVVVPAGTFNLRVCFTPNGVPVDETVTATYNDSVQVTGDTTKNMTLPGVTLFAVSGTVTGLSSIQSLSSPSIEFVSSDNTAEGKFNLNTSSGAFQGLLASGSYGVSLGGTVGFSIFSSEQMSLLNVGSLSVSGNTTGASFSVPPTARLSGTVQAPAGVFPGSSVRVTDTSAPVPTEITCCSEPATSSTIVDFTNNNQYQMFLTRNRSYQLAASVVMLGTGGVGAITYPVSPSPLSLNADITRDLAIPALPGSVTVSGKVTDTGGKGVSNVIVTASSQSISGASGVGYTALGGMTDADGNFSFSVLMGTNFLINFMPPMPNP
jgi:hypothetical protein